MRSLLHGLGVAPRLPTSRFALGVVLQTLTLASGVALLWTSAWLLSKAALRPGLAALQIAIVGVRFLGLSRALLRYLERLVSHDATLRWSARLRAALARSLVPLSPARLLGFRGGDLLSRLLGDVEAVENAGVRAALPFASAILLALGLLLVIPSAGLAVTLLVGLVTAGLAAPALAAARGAGASRRQVEVKGGLEARLVDGVRGLADLVAFGREGAHAAGVEAESRLLASAQVQVGRASGLGAAVTSLATDLSAIAALILAASLVRGGALAGERLAGVVLLTLASFEAAAGLPAAFAALGAARVGTRRLAEVLDAAPAVVEPLAPRSPGSGCHLEARGLAFGYPGEARPVLEDVSLVIEPGRLLAVVGPSGAGKSTLAHLLVRFWDVPIGALFLDGIDVRALSGDDVRARVGLVSQRFHVFGATLRENLLLARPGASRAQVEEAAQWAGLDGVVAVLEKGWDTYVGEQGARLSGGQRQRLALARAYLMPSPLLVLDEPTTHLDPAAEVEVLGRMAELSRRRGVLVITHRLAGLRAAHEIVVLAGGRVVERGTLEELGRAGGVFARARAAERGLLGDERFA